MSLSHQQESMLILTRSQVLKLLTYELGMRANRNLFQTSPNLFNQHLIPIRTVLQIPNEGATLFMPCFLSPNAMSSTIDQSTNLGIKVVSVRQDNPVKYQKDSIGATIMLFHQTTGDTACVMHASDVTAVRTACGSALAVEKILSCSEAEKKTLGIFGCGKQGQAHLFSVLRIAPHVKRVLLWNKNEERAQTLKRQLLDEFVGSDDLPFEFTDGSQHDQQTHIWRRIEIQVQTNADNAAEMSDIICCCTNASTPLFDGNKIKNGTIVTCIGSYKPNMQEVDSNLVARSKVVADLVEAVWEESGDLIIPLNEKRIQHDHIICGLSELLQYEKEEYLSKFNPQNDVIIFKSVGFAGQDIAVAREVYQSALQLKIGTEIDMNL